MTRIFPTNPGHKKEFTVPLKENSWDCGDRFFNDIKDGRTNAA